METGKLVSKSGDWIADYELTKDGNYWELTVFEPYPDYDPNDEFPSVKRVEFSGPKGMLLPSLERTYGYGCRLE